MPIMNTERRSFLQESFPERVTFSETERKLYGHDVGDLPRLIKPLVGKTIPDAVVQPASESEVVALVNWAREQGIALTPRGKATSGYGGVLPIKKGVVVDFHRMDRLLAIDPDGLTVTVQPGIIWEKLDMELAKSGLTLRLYPTSYPASTAGGWLAQGGAGIGSYESGWFGDNVLKARAVLPTGEVREFAGQELDLIYEAEGITGLVTELTVAVKPLEDLTVRAISFPTAEGLQQFASLVHERKVPLWSFLFINPKMAELRNITPLREHLGHPAEERVTLPETYVATVAFRSSNAAAVEEALKEIYDKAGGTLLDQHIADHEWENRFKVMMVKRLGPSLVPAEVLFPLDSLAAVMTEIQAKISKPIVKEGIVLVDQKDGKPYVVILGFIPSDQRKFNYHFIFSLSLSITKIAEKHGGSAYASGLYFKTKTERVLGADRVRKLKDFKTKVDPKGFMNPGKVLGGGLVSSAIGVAGAFEPITRIFGNSSTTSVGIRLKGDVKDIPEDVAWNAYSCSQCGFCISTCDQFYGRGWESQSPRGKWYWLREYMEGREKWNQAMVDTILSCTTCERCNLRCSEGLPIESSWMKLRGKLIHEEKKMTFPPFELMAEALSTEGNIWAGYRKNRLDWFPEDLKEKHGPGKKAKAVYFAGCTASYVEHDIAMATARILDEAGVDFVHAGTDENCCGTPMLVAGKWELFAETMKKNIKAIKATGADTVICSCPACDMMWRHTYPEWAEKLGVEYGLSVKHYSEVLAEKIKTGEFSFPAAKGAKKKVTWHDSCHVGRVSGIYEPPRDLIKANPKAEFVEMESNRENGRCCGSVLTLIKEPKIAAVIGKDRLDEAVDAGAEQVLALCPCCEVQLRVSADRKNIPVEVVDLARFTAEALGYDLPDPNAEVKKQWAVFEAMIELMTPQGFADLMGTMWPELIDAMPLGMGPMMRLMGKIPGILSMMKPVFPVLFPMLLPRMMPKVMPVMLQRVADKIPMPDYMKEQMPDMMPKVMDNLMPHMVGDVVPLVTQPMINYLRGK